MDLMAGRVLDNYDSPEVRITLKILDNNVLGAGVKLINDTLAVSPTVGSITGDAAWNAGGYILLTPATASKLGRWEFLGEVGNEFVLTFDHYAGGGTGADALWFYWGCDSLPSTEEAAAGGYILNLDEYESDAVKLNFNGSVVGSGSTGVTLDSGTWRRMKVVFDGKKVRLYVNDVLAFEYTDSKRSLPGNKFGFGARTGGSTNEHRIRNVVLQNGLEQKKGYDIESLFVGQMIKILNSTSKGENKWDVMQWDVDSWDYDITNAAATPLQIQSIEYHPDYAILEVSNLQPDIAKRIEDINRNLVNRQTADNPVTPS